MDYKELLGDREFNSPEEICEWMDSAATAITDLLARAEAVEARAEKAERERDAAVALVHEWEQYGRYLSPMGFTVPPNWRED